MKGNGGRVPDKNLDDDYVVKIGNIPWGYVETKFPGL